MLDVVLGVEVIVPFVVMFIVENVETGGIVTDPRSDTETTVFVVAAVISVEASVAVPSLTFTSTTVAVTVTSGTRGRRTAAC